MDNHLHIITHDVPWPADYGGVTDLFYKIKALHGKGIKIHLHCFSGGREEQKILDDFCKSVYYYPRKKNLNGFSLRLPYIVQSRSDSSLLKNLEKDDHPILLEGIHCTYFLQHDNLKNRKIFVRLHNVEFKYYSQLAKHEKNIFKKIYFLWESRLLKKYEKEIANKGILLAVSKADAEIYANEFDAKDVYDLPVFLPWNKTAVLPGKGSYCLYHGNLSVNENEKAAVWLMDKVFFDSGIDFIIAGKNPSNDLLAKVKKSSHIKVVANPTEDEMKKLIKNAQVNVLPSFNNTGIKLKVLNAMYNGRHCLINKEAVEGSGMDEYCTIATTAETFKKSMKDLFEKEFTKQEEERRNEALKKIYNNEKNGAQLITWLYSHYPTPSRVQS